MRSRSKTTSNGPQRLRRVGAQAVLVLVAAALAAAVWLRSSQPEPAAPVDAPTTKPAPQATVAPEDWDLPDDLPPLPLPTAPLPRAAYAIRAAYEFAARQPEILEGLPCYCGCQRLGHRSIRACFVAARGTAGRITWDAHAMG